MPAIDDKTRHKTLSGRRLMSRILSARGLRVVFQPIFDIQGPQMVLAAAECLVRGPEGTPIENAPDLFRFVQSRHAEVLADRTCVAQALRAAQGLGQRVDLTLNVHAATLGRDHEFPSHLADSAALYGLAVDRMIVEIVRLSDRHGPALGNNLEGLRQIGVRIALDNVGSNGANLRALLDLRPDFLKLDRYLVEGVRVDYRRQAVLQAISALARELGTRVVAEGVEHPGDLAALRHAGVHLAQGYLFSEPLDADRFARSGFIR